MNLTRKDVQLFETLARGLFFDVAANKDFADGTPAVEYHAKIATLRAALSLFQTMGLVQAGVTLDLKDPYQE